MDIAGLAWTLASFFFVLSVLVFVHEWGHYRVARACGVRVLVFSIGFGPELLGWNDRRGVRWRLSAIPLGGYVRFFGDADASSHADQDALSRFSAAERAVSFHHQPIHRRALIVAAGPLINFAFAILLFAALFMIVGQPFSPPIVAEVLPDSPAQRAGLAVDDRFISIDGTPIRRFEDVVEIILTHPDHELPLVVERQAGSRVALSVTPARVAREDRFGNRYQIGQIGVRGVESQWVQRGLVASFYFAAQETGRKIVFSLKTMGQIIMGIRPIDELGGPVRIAKTSGEVAQLGWADFLKFMALISISLGLINLLPIPVLDGGHLLFYAIEALKGSPLSVRAQDLSYLTGLCLVLSLMIFVTWNDLNSL